jgi:CRP/FNR family transcriptional regulator, cyclic AMP receptor protein
MEMIDTVGYLAAGLVLATFCMRSMGTLRMAAIASNLAFIAYGYVGSLAPVLLLHVLLLPVNIYRLLQLGWPDKSPLAVRARSSTSRRWHRV